MRLRQRRSDKVASGKRAARGHWDIRKREGRPARARGISGVPLPPGARAGRNPIGYGSNGRALRACHWLPSFTRLPARGNHNGNRLGFAS